MFRPLQERVFDGWDAAGTAFPWPAPGGFGMLCGMLSPDLFIGIAVSGRRTITVCAASPHGQCLWLEACRPADLGQVLRKIERRTASRRWAVGIDAPRTFPSKPRLWEWRAEAWRRGSGSLAGRHCEVVLKALALAAPAWTPLEKDAPRWMREGAALYRAFEDRAPAGRIHEIFSTASRRQFARLTSLRVPHRGMLRRPRNLTPGDSDELDAFIAAWTVAVFESGDGCAVGSGDGLGAVILPGTLPPDCPPALLLYPSSPERSAPALYEAAPMG